MRWLQLPIFIVRFFIMEAPMGKKCTVMRVYAADGKGSRLGERFYRPFQYRVGASPGRQDSPLGLTFGAAIISLADARFLLDFWLCPWYLPRRTEFQTIMDCKNEYALSAAINRFYENAASGAVRRCEASHCRSRLALHLGRDGFCLQPKNPRGNK